MAKNKTLTEIELWTPSNAKNVEGVIWKWSDGTVSYSPSTLRSTNTTKLTLDKN